MLKMHVLPSPLTHKRKDKIETMETQVLQKREARYMENFFIDVYLKNNYDKLR